MFAILKRLLPRGLFGRWFLLLVTPIVLLQILATYIFYESHWERVSRRLALGVAGEIAGLIELRRLSPELWASGEVPMVSARHFELFVQFEPDKRLPEVAPRLNPFSILDQMLTQALRERLSQPFQIDTNRGDESIVILVGLEDGLLRVETLQKRLFSSTTYVFILWMVGGSIVLLGIAVLFLRNQVRPILRLAQAAEAFGKGQDVEDFRPTGASEVRRASAAFIAMRQRIKKFVRQRTHMLAGVSHDLRTPLTRMKLQLAMMPKSEATEGLAQDVASMQRMVDAYLAFVRGEEGEDAQALDLRAVLTEAASSPAWRGRLSLRLPHEAVPMMARPDSLRRAFSNVIENAMKYARHAEIRLEHKSEGRRGAYAHVIVDDDGPGVPPDAREKIFQPFVRLDDARTQLEGDDQQGDGVGLGLAITQDAVHAHGGSIALDQSSLGGLRVVIRLPL